MTIACVNSRDHGGLQFQGDVHTLLQTTVYLREAIGSDPNCPNYVSDFIFALEMECHNHGVMDDHFNVVNGE
jgi:hypothetical protein